MTFKLELNGGKMTDRDRKLLVAGAVAAILVGVGLLVIRPLVLDIQDTFSRIETEQALRDTNEEKTILLAQQRAQNQSLKLQLESASEDYFPMMTSQEISRLYTEMALDYHLNALNLNIAMPSAMQNLEPYVNSIAAQADAVQASGASTASEDTEIDPEDPDSAEDATTSTAVVAATAQDVASNLYTANVSMLLQGDAAVLQQLLDDICSDQPAIRVVSFSWGTASIVQDQVIIDVATLQLETELYMLYSA